MSEESNRQDEGKSDQQRAEEIVQYLREEHDGKKLPHAINELRVGSHRSGDGPPFATLDTGTWEGQITVAGVRFHQGVYELRDWENRCRRYATLDQLKAGLAALLESVTAEQLDRAVAEGIRRPGRR